MHVYISGTHLEVQYEQVIMLLSHHICYSKLQFLSMFDLVILDKLCMIMCTLSICWK